MLLKYILIGKAVGKDVKYILPYLSIYVGFKKVCFE